jgi:hypothetical protein
LISKCFEGNVHCFERGSPPVENLLFCEHSLKPFGFSSSCSILQTVFALCAFIMAPARALLLSMLMSVAAAESCKENDALCKESSSDGFQQLVQVQVAKKQNSTVNPYCAPNGGNAWWPSSRQAPGQCSVREFQGTQARARRKTRRARER